MVVPFAGRPQELVGAVERLRALRLGPADTITVADNRRPGAPVPPLPGEVRLIAAGARRGSYFARNRGAEIGSNPWLVFLDADVAPSPGLLDAYLAAARADAVGVLVGAVRDEPPRGRASVAERFAHRRALMSQERTSERPQWAYAQTANCAVRRRAFEQVGGFVETVRSGGDADLCFRIRAAGWTIEPAPEAGVVHHNRRTLRALLRQRARVGAGAEWLERRYPGFMPPRPLASALAGGAVQVARGLYRTRSDRVQGELEAVQGLADLAFAVGRRLPNEPRSARGRH